jgi:site-specific DNA-adenine methylase
MTTLKAPFPYAGGKSKIAHVVWERFGDVYGYVEPFAGSLAVLLARPHEPRIETVNDMNCYVANFWRALKNDPEGVASWADYPVIHADLTARHKWLVNNEEFRQRMFDDPDYFDSKVAGWWVWGASAWIGSGWCEAGDVSQVPRLSGTNGVHRSYLKQQRPQLRPHQGIQSLDVTNKIPLLGHRKIGGGVHRDSLVPEEKRPNLPMGNGSRGSVNRPDLYEYMNALAERLRRVRVVNGDWSQVVGPSVTYLTGLTGVFMDPPYSAEAGRDMNLYAVESGDVAHDVREWCLEEVEDRSGRYTGPRYLHPKMRIALCGYEGEGHEVLESLGWDVVAWKANGGYSNQNREGNDNRHKERIWFSPHCLKPDKVEQLGLF